MKISKLSTLLKVWLKNNSFSMADICTNSKFEKFKENNIEEQVFNLDLFTRSDSETILR